MSVFIVFLLAIVCVLMFMLADHMDMLKAREEKIEQLECEILRLRSRARSY